MRERERAGVLEALQLAGDMAEVQDKCSHAVHRFLGRANCMLCMTQLDDLLDEHEPTFPRHRRSTRTGDENIRLALNISSGTIRPGSSSK
jgi:hypothetical protein